jgi:hypothetical protein
MKEVEVEVEWNEMLDVTDLTAPPELSRTP